MPFHPTQGALAAAGFAFDDAFAQPSSPQPPRSIAQCVGASHTRASPSLGYGRGLVPAWVSGASNYED